MLMTDEVSKSRPRIACRLELLPGRSLHDRIAAAARFGFDAVALPGRMLKDYAAELQRSSPPFALPFSSLSLGFGGSLISRLAQRRAECRDSLLNLFDFCRVHDIPRLNMPPALLQDNGKNLAPPAKRDALLTVQLAPLAEAAAERGVTLLLEPVNRYESDYLNTLAHAAALCEAVGHPALGVTADLFHMQLEERQAPSALRATGNWLKCVHVADNTRLEPGSGSMAFAPVFAALQTMGYRGDIEVESRGLSGDPETCLPAAVRTLQRAWRDAKSTIRAKSG